MNNYELYYKDLEIIGKNGQLNIVIDGSNAVIKMIRGQHLCGYVEVPDSIANLINENEIKCHGGITFNAKAPIGFPTSGYYIGFDCAHANDWYPGSEIGTWKSIEYVKHQIKNIISQYKEYKEVTK